MQQMFILYPQTQELLYKIYIWQIIGSGNVVVHAHIYDNSATTQFTFAKHTIAANEFKKCIRWSIVLEENDVLRVQAASANDIEGTCAILEINRD